MIKIPVDIQNKILHEYVTEKRSVLSISKDLDDYSYDVVYRFIKKTSGLEIRGNVFNSRIYDYDINFFDVIDNEEKAYWLGFIYADGYVTKRGNTYQLGIALGRKDKSHLKKFVDSLNSNLKIHDYVQDSAYLKGTLYSRVLISNNHICEQLMNKGCTRKKTNTLTFPSEEIVPKNLINHFIRGYFDGDGCLTGYYVSKKEKHEYQVKILGTMEFLNGLHENLPVTRVFSPRRRFKEKDTNNFTLEIGGKKQVFKILEFFYDNSNIFLDRKYAKYMEFLKLCVE